MNKLRFFLLLFLSLFLHAMQAQERTIENHVPDNVLNSLAIAKKLYMQGSYKKAKKIYEKNFEDIKNGNITIGSLSNGMYTNDQLCDDKTNYGQCCWALGDYRAGHQYFDARLEHSNTKPLKKPLTEEKLQELIKEEKLKDTTLFVRAEHGLGDTFTFIKWLQVLKKNGATIILLAQNPLKSLLSRSTECVSSVINSKDTEPTFDYDFYLMSAPRFCSVLGIKPTKVTGDIPHFVCIHPLEHKVLQWKEKLQGCRPLGICWAASNNPVPGGRLLKRNIPLKILAQLSTLDNVKLYNLQGLPHKPISETEYKKLKKCNALNGIDRGDILPTEYTVHSFDDMFDKDEPFGDTAAVMKAIDMLQGVVISVDTSTLNLAGALNVRAIGLFANQANIDARWGIVYPGTRLGILPLYKVNTVMFSQDKDGRWQTVVDNVKENLKIFWDNIK